MKIEKRFSQIIYAIIIITIGIILELFIALLAQAFK